MVKKNVVDDRKHCFTFIVYPDDVISDWVKYLEDLLIPILISPLHDKDFLPDGTPKKPHYHVLIDFGQNRKSLDQLHQYLEPLGSGVCIAPIDPKTGTSKSWVSCKRTLTRYFTHADNPDKAQYSCSDCIALGGFDYWKIYNSSSNKYGTLRDIVYFCKTNQIDCFADLLDYCMDNNEQWFMCLTDCGVNLIKEYMKSRTWSNRVHDTK